MVVVMVVAVHATVRLGSIEEWGTCSDGINGWQVHGMDGCDPCCLQAIGPVSKRQGSLAHRQMRQELVHCMRV